MCTGYTGTCTNSWLMTAATSYSNGHCKYFAVCNCSLYITCHWACGSMIWKWDSCSASHAWIMQFLLPLLLGYCALWHVIAYLRMRGSKLKYLYITQYVAICLSQSAGAIVYGDWMNDMAAPLRFHAWVIYSAECNLQNTTPATVVGTIDRGKDLFLFLCWNKWTPP